MRLRLAMDSELLHCKQSRWRGCVDALEHRLMCFTTTQTATSRQGASNSERTAVVSCGGVGGSEVRASLTHTPHILKQVSTPCVWEFTR